MSVFHAGHALPSAKPLRLAAGKRGLNLLLGAATLALRLAFRRRPQEPRTVVVLEPFGMGDVIALEPLVSALAAAGLRVVLAGRPAWAALAPPHPGVSWLDIDLPWAAYSASAKYLDKNFHSRLAPALDRLRAVARGAIGLDPRGDMRSVSLLWRAGCARVLSPTHYIHSTARNLPWACEQWSPRPGFHKFRSNLEALRFLGLPLPAPRAPALPHLHPGGSPEDRLVSLVPAAPWAGKHWSPDRWSALAQRLLAQGWALQVLCGPGQAASARTLVAAPLPIAECTDIPAWARRLARSTAVVTVDSGPMHLAAALGVPVVALFGGGLLPCWGPVGTRTAIVTAQFDDGFGPCHQTEFNLAFERRMMEAITVEETLDALRLVAPFPDPSAPR
jgi:ADP-heptose:LPS heptosyltransferase